MATKAIKLAVADFFYRFVQSIVPTTPAIQRFKQRKWREQMAIVPGRLVEDAQAMLDKWREKGVNGARSPLPVFIIGFAKDYASTGLEKGRSVAASQFMVQDDKGNFFRVRVDKHDQRVQAVLFAPDHETAFSLASQFKLFCNDFGNRHIFAISEYNGLHYGFPMTLEDPNIFGSNGQIAEQDNLTVLVFDLSFNCNTPYFLGDVTNNQPYFSVVKTAIVDSLLHKNRELVYHQVEGAPFEERL